MERVRRAGQVSLSTWQPIFPSLLSPNAPHSLAPAGKLAVVVGRKKELRVLSMSLSDAYRKR